MTSTPAQSAPTQTKRLWFLPPVLLIFCGVVLGIVVVVWSVVSFSSRVASAETHSSSDGPIKVALTSGERAGIWTTSGGVPNCVVTDSSGSAVALDTSAEWSVKIGNYQLASSFTLPSSGDVSVSCTASGTAFSFKVADVPNATSFAVGLAVGILLAVLSPFAGCIWIVVSLLRRSRRQKTLA